MTAIVNALAPGLNTMPLTSTQGRIQRRPVVLETSNVAVSAGPLGMVAGVQLSERVSSGRLC